MVPCRERRVIRCADGYVDRLCLGSTAGHWRIGFVERPPGWRDDRPAAAWPALGKSCERLPARDIRWRGICADAALFPDPDDATARAFSRRVLIRMWCTATAAANTTD